MSANCNEVALKQITDRIFPIAKDPGMMFWILSHPSFQDVKIIINGEDGKELQTLWVHRHVLVARSIVFATMLDADMLESHTSTITIQEYSVVAVRQFLHLLYTCYSDQKYPITTSIWIEILFLSMKYEVTRIIFLCLQRLTNSLLVHHLDNIEDCQLICNLVDILHSNFAKPTGTKIAKAVGTFITNVSFILFTILGNKELAKLTNEKGALFERVYEIFSNAVDDDK
jgi:hypothetical protein